MFMYAPCMLNKDFFIIIHVNWKQLPDMIS